MNRQQGETVERGQVRLSAVGPLAVLYPELDARGGFTGRWWCDQSWSGDQRIWTTADLLSLPRTET